MKFLKISILLLNIAWLFSCSSTPEADGFGGRSPASSSGSDDACGAITRSEKDATNSKLTLCRFTGDDEKKHELKVMEIPDLAAMTIQDLRPDPKAAVKENRSLPSSGAGFFSPSAFNQKGLGSVHAVNVNGGSGELHLVFVKGEAHRYFLILDANGVAVAGANDLGVSVSVHAVPGADVISTRSISSTEKTPLPQPTGILSDFLARGDSVESLQKQLEAKSVSGRWSFLFADSNSGRSSVLEVGKTKVKTWENPSRADKPVAQGNHFLGTQMQDQFAYENFGNALTETARFVRLSELVAHLKPEELTLDQTLWILGDHYDANVPADPVLGNERSFGPTVVRSDTRASLVMVPDKLHPKVWVSIGDHESGPLGHFAGFELDFAKGQWKSLGLVQNAKAAEGGDWNQSLDEFVEAVRYAENENWENAVNAIDNALADADKDRHRFDPSYHFAKARVLLRMALKEDDLGIKKDEMIIAMEEFDKILLHHSLMGSMKSTVLLNPITGASLVESYIEALSKLYSVAAAMALDDVKASLKSDEQQALVERHQMNSETKTKRLLAAEDTLQFILKHAQSPDIRAKLQFLEGLKSKTKFDDLPWSQLDLVSIVN